MKKVRELAVSADHRLKIKVNEKRNEPENEKVMDNEIHLDTGNNCGLRMVHKFWVWRREELEIWKRAGIVQTIALLWSVIILKISGDLLSLRLQWKTIR